MIRLLQAASLGLATALASPACATSTLLCAIDDANLALRLQAHVGSDGTIVPSISGWLRLKPDITEIPIDAGNLRQQWNADNELMLGIGVSDTSGSSVFLAILAVRHSRSNDDADHYGGRYVLKRAGTETTLRGVIRGCEVG